MTKNRISLLIHTILPVAMGAAIAVSGMTHDAPEGHYNGHLGTLPPGHAKVHNDPSFVPTPGCRPEVRLTDTLLVIDWDSEVHRMDYDEVEDRVRDGGTNWANDVWVIGSC
jgi:hypothetical protein